MAIERPGIPKVYFRNDKGEELLVINIKEYYDYDNRKILEYELSDNSTCAFIAEREIK